jgi:hypothetical protein
MVGPVIASDRALLGWPTYLSLIFKIVIGAAVLFGFHRPRFASLRGMLRTLRDTRPSAVYPSAETAISRPLAELVGAV